jgi:hypothetical protein
MRITRQFTPASIREHLVEGKKKVAMPARPLVTRQPSVVLACGKCSELTWPAQLGIDAQAASAVD